MIIGLGSDLIDIRRMEKTLERFGQRFIDRVFTDVGADEVRAPGRSGSPPMPSGSPPRKPARRRSAPG